MAKAKRAKARAGSSASKAKGAAAGGGNIRRILNCIPSREQEKDWQFENALAAGAAMAGPIPTSKDLRAAWWPVNDQGSTGSCVGWATADSVVRWHFAKAGKIAQQPQDMLSSRFIWMASKEFDEFTTAPTTFIESAGTSLKSALDIARKYGCVKNSVLSFASGALYQNEEKTFYALAARLKIASYINLGANPQQWRTWLANNGPILTRLNVDSTWDNAGQTSGNLAVYNPATVRGGHAVALVGYTPTAFIVRNSWGPTWGQQGFGYASNAYAAAAFTEAYGVTV